MFQDHAITESLQARTRQRQRGWIAVNAQQLSIRSRSFQDAHGMTARAYRAIYVAPS
jgi:hypothetical protein